MFCALIQNYRHLFEKLSASYKSLIVNCPGTQIQHLGLSKTSKINTVFWLLNKTVNSFDP